jgi:hypothetical protein
MIGRDFASPSNLSACCATQGEGCTGSIRIESSRSQPASIKASTSDCSAALRIVQSALRTRTNPAASESARPDRFFGRSSHSRWGSRVGLGCPEGRSLARLCSIAGETRPSRSRASSLRFSLAACRRRRFSALRCACSVSAVRARQDDVGSSSCRRRTRRRAAPCCSSARTRRRIPFDVRVGQLGWRSHTFLLLPWDISRDICPCDARPTHADSKRRF